MKKLIYIAYRIKMAIPASSRSLYKQEPLDRQGRKVKVKLVKSWSSNMWKTQPDLSLIQFPGFLFSDCCKIHVLMTKIDYINCSNHRDVFIWLVNFLIKRAGFWPWKGVLKKVWKHNKVTSTWFPGHLKSNVNYSLCSALFPPLIHSTIFVEDLFCAGCCSRFEGLTKTCTWGQSVSL